MSSPRSFVVAAVVALVLTGCASSSNNETASPPRPTPAPSAVATQPSAPVGGGPYDQALSLHSCYQQTIDAADDPLGLDVPCDQPKAAWRLAGIQAASAGDCPSGQASENEKQANANVIGSTLCLEPVTH